jgi:hypothetical protein
LRKSRSSSLQLSGCTVTLSRVWHKKKNKETTTINKKKKRCGRKPGGELKKKKNNYLLQIRDAFRGDEEEGLERLVIHVRRIALRHLHQHDTRAPDVHLCSVSKRLCPTTSQSQEQAQDMLFEEEEDQEAGVETNIVTEAKEKGRSGGP